MQRAMQARDRSLLGSEYRTTDWVFTNDYGDPLAPNSPNTAWYQALDKADVPRIRFHDLPHTHASVLLKQGVNLKIVSVRPGHAIVQLTLDTYSHVLPGLQREAANRFDDLPRDVRKQ
jgi:integrase